MAIELMGSQIQKFKLANFAEFLLISFISIQSKKVNNDFEKYDSVPLEDNLIRWQH